MGMYGFKPQFWAYLLDGSKAHTIRVPRVHPDQPGSTLYHYGNPRRRDCFLLQEVRCAAVKPIVLGRAFIELDGVRLNSDERDGLAWRDGFRPAGSTEGKPGPAFAQMAGFWRGSLLPLEANIMYWELPRLKLGPNAGAMLELWAIAAGRPEVESFARSLQGGEI